MSRLSLLPRNFDLHSAFAHGMIECFFGIIATIIGAWLFEGAIRPVFVEPQKPSDARTQTAQGPPSTGLAPDLPRETSKQEREKKSDPVFEPKDIQLPGPDGRLAATVHERACKIGDLSGRFSAVVFSDVYSWKYGSRAAVEFDGHELDDFAPVLLREGMQSSMEGAEVLVAVGTASCEGVALEDEEDRALARAKKLKGWLQETHPVISRSAATLPYRTLTLGRFKREGYCDPKRSPETRDQRKVILIAIVQHDPRLGLEECLKQSLSADPALTYLVDRYSQFRLDADSPASAMKAVF